MLLCRCWLWVTPKRLKKYSYAKTVSCAWDAPASGRKWRLLTGLSGSTVLLIPQSATHQCGTNQSCACVVIVIMFEPVSEGAEIPLSIYVVTFMICTSGISRPHRHNHNAQSCNWYVCKDNEKKRSIDYLWKLIWKLAACWGLENVAIAFLCCGIILNICDRARKEQI